MWTENRVFSEDLEQIAGCKAVRWEQLEGKTVLVTGATGLIGFNLVSALVYRNVKTGRPIQVIAPVRDVQKAERMFACPLREGKGSLHLMQGDVTAPVDVAGGVDYIIHGASVTSSRAFVQNPVETIGTALQGTQNMLSLARQKAVSGFVYLSSMEVYGYPPKGRRVTEDEIGALSPLIGRNSYPLSKQMCESLCMAYAAEYGVPARIVRLTQTFGPGVSYRDGRVFAEFARCALEHRNIVLKTAGETERSYLYTADAVTAILAVLTAEKAEKAYHAANEQTYCSIAQMASLVAGMGGVQVTFDLATPAQKLGYADTLYMNLDTTRLRALGWEAQTGLEQMFARMMAAFGRDV